MVDEKVTWTLKYERKKLSYAMPQTGGNVAAHHKVFVMLSEIENGATKRRHENMTLNIK